MDSPPTCHRCGATVGPLRLTAAGWECLRHMARLIVVRP